MQANRFVEFTLEEMDMMRANLFAGDARNPVNLRLRLELLEAWEARNKTEA